MVQRGEKGRHPGRVIVLIELLVRMVDRKVDMVRRRLVAPAQATLCQRVIGPSTVAVVAVASRRCCNVAAWTSVPPSGRTATEPVEAVGRVEGSRTVMMMIRDRRRERLVRQG